MTEQIFTLLGTNPILSISLGFALAVLILILFRKTFEKWLMKKLNLYSEEEVKSAVLHLQTNTDNTFKTSAFNETINEENLIEKLKYLREEFGVRR